MAWFGGPPRQDESTLRTILRDVITPVSLKVDAMDSKIDRVVDALRKELGDAVREIGQQYLRADVANQRFSELKARLDTHDADIKNLQTAPAQAQQQSWMRWGIIAGMAAGALGGLISIINLIAHLSYHP